MHKQDINKHITSYAISEYFRNLVNHFFKILPMKENGESTLYTYIESLQSELLGLHGILIESKNDYRILSLLSILQYLIDNKECSTIVVRREVFKAISICNKMCADYYSYSDKEVVNFN